MLSTVVIICSAGVAACQSETVTRYKDIVFEKTIVTKNLVYKTNVPGDVKMKAYTLDLYQPLNDTTLLRPLVIWMHGGGFKLGSKRARGIPGWSKRFACRGYVCAAINYRKSKKKPLSRFPDLVEGCYDAIQDLSTAISYLKANATAWGIDTNYIILAGNSAGAITALQAVYSSPRALARLYNPPDSSHMNTSGHIKNIAGIINFWGGIFDTTWLRNAHVPIVSVHGEKDNIVPYKKADAPLYGSFYVNREAQRLGIPTALKSYPRYRHELQVFFFPFLAGFGAHRRWKEAGQFASDFLYAEVLKK